MKKVLSLILSCVMLTSMFAVNFNAYASGWLDDVQKIEFYTNYLESVDSTDYYDGCYNNAFKFVVPQKGTLTLYLESDYSDYAFGVASVADYNVYKASDVDNVFGEFEPYKEGHSSARDVYYEYSKITLNKGTYYVVIRNGSSTAGKVSYEFSIKYRPIFANTSITKLTSKKNAFNVKWKKASYATGYQIKYSLKKNMKSSKTVIIKSNSTTSRTIKKLKRKKVYYVKVRSYKKVKVDGHNKTFYGKWSAKKKIKTK